MFIRIQMHMFEEIQNGYFLKCRKSSEIDWKCKLEDSLEEVDKTGNIASY